MERVNHILELKKQGHQLLDDYVALDLSYKSIKTKMDYVYIKLANKLGVTAEMAHFGSMQTTTEVLNAISKLTKMIKKRKDKIKYLKLDKNEVAPNVAELQKSIGNLNTKVCS